MVQPKYVDVDGLAGKKESRGGITTRFAHARGDDFLNFEFGGLSAKLIRARAP